MNNSIPHSMDNPNDQLMEQCRREAEERFKAPHVTHPSWDEQYRVQDVILYGREAYAAALYTERSKPRLMLELSEQDIERMVDEGRPTIKTMTYTMSRDYEKLYDIAKSGEYVLGWMVFPTHKVSALIKWFDPVMHVGHTAMHDDKELFIAECTRLNLEWLAPVDLAGVIAAGDEMHDRLQETRIKVVNGTECYDDGQIMLDSEAQEAWTTATEQFRKP